MLQSVIQEANPDVVHWHNTKGFFGSPVHFPGRQSLYTAHDYYSVCPRSNLLKPNREICVQPRACVVCNLRWRKPPPLWRAWGRRVIHIPNETKVLCPSKFMAERLRSDGLRVHRIIPNFVPDYRRQGASDRIYDQNLMLYTGMLEAHKGLTTLLDAFALRKDEHKFQLKIIGDGPLKNHLEEHILKLGIGDRATILGFLPESELLSVRRQAAIQVIPSEWYENAPLTALEALAMGVPLIGSAIGGIPEIVDEASGGVLYRAGDARELAQCMVDLWKNREMFPEMREKARNTYERRFTSEVHIKAYLEAIKG
jgi:glycosyltransferase involved in cell wall biosynthesis